MAESTSNIEFAHRIQEHAPRHMSFGRLRAQWIELAEAAVLAMVAIATAWSGYQASKWDAVSAKFYNMASRFTMKSEQLATLAGQDRLYDITTFGLWLQAKNARNDKLSAFYKRRFRTEYARAFNAWEKLDPINDPSAPGSPIFMAEYTNSKGEESARLAKQAEDHFHSGVATRETGDEYVKITVFLATVLLLTALSQRFENLWPRIAVFAVASALLLTSVYWILILPQA